jgi:hypothetical protein
MPQSGCTIAPEPDVNLGILVGLLLTDGWVNSRGVIGLANKSEELHKIFKEKILKVFGDQHFVEFKDKRTEVGVTEVNSVKIARAVNKLMKTGSKKHLPEFFNQLTLQQIQKVLQVMFSADGSICLGVKWNYQENRWKFTRKVKLTCWDSVLREDIGTLLQKLDIEFNLEPKTKPKEIVIEKQNEIIKFAKKIRFVNGVKISGKSKNWRGFEKNQILDLAIKTFRLKKKNLQHLKTKEEVINFLKHLLR